MQEKQCGINQQVLLTTSEESMTSGTVLGEEFFAISPVVVELNSTSRVDTE